MTDAAATAGNAPEEALADAPADAPGSAPATAHAEAPAAVSLPAGVDWITDPTDPRLTDYVALTDVALRRRTEPERGLYVAESEKVIRRALAAGHRPRSFLMAARWLTDLGDVVAWAREGGIPVYAADHPVIERLTGFHLHRGALASMQRPVLPDVGELLAGARRVLVLEDIVDHTNVGACFRSAAALGVDAVLVTPRCADPLYRRSVRVSMGTVFQVPWTRIEPWPRGGPDVLREHGFTVAAFALADDAVTLDAVAADPPERLALVLGTEGDGLTRHTIAAADLAVRIPMAGGVDSLNVAAACAVALWALRPGGSVGGSECGAIGGPAGGSATGGAATV